MSKHPTKKFGHFPSARGLYDPGHEHDSCGVGFVAQIDGHPSHAIIQHGIKVLENLMHRGAIGGDQKTGDGAGMLFQIPDEFFRIECQALGIDLPAPKSYGVGMVFLPRQSKTEKTCRQMIAKVVEIEGLTFLGWRDVPVDPVAIAGQAKKTQPVIKQFFIDGNNALIITAALSHEYPAAGEIFNVFRLKGLLVRYNDFVNIG